MPTTKTTAPWNLGYLAGYQQQPKRPDRSDWDAGQRHAYREAYDLGAFERHAYDSAATDPSHHRPV